MKNNIFVVLLCALLSVSADLYAGYAKVTVTATSSPADLGYVSLDFSNYKEVGKDNSVTDSYQSNWVVGGNVRVSFYLQAKSAKYGYYCVGWFDSSNSQKSFNVQYKQDGTYNAPIAWKTNEYAESYYALFKPVEVTSPASGSTINGVTLTEPAGKAENATVELSVNATCTEDFIVTLSGNDYIRYNSHSFESGKLIIRYTYSAHNVHGTDKATISVTSAGGENRYTYTLICTTDLTPTFTLSSTSVSFGEVSIVGSGTQSVAPSTTNVPAQNAEWTMWVDGSDKGNFSIVGIGGDGYAHPANGKAEVSFAPNAARTFAAQLNAYCVYTDATGKKIQSATSTINLTGTGVVPQEASLTLSNVSTNLGDYEGGRYTYLDQCGTVARTADFAIGRANVGAIQYSFGETNAAGVFSYAVQQEADGKERLTIQAQSQSALSVATIYSATLTISAQSTIAADNAKVLTQTLHLQVTIQPKKKNTLAWGLPLYSNKQFYVLYTDAKNLYALSDINNIDTINYPISISCTTSGYDKYFSIDNVKHTLSAIAVRDADMVIKATQPESDEYESATITANLRVRKHNFSWVYNPIDDRRTSQPRLYKNTLYHNFISSNSIAAGEAGGFSKFDYRDGYAHDFGQTLIANADGSYDLQTGDKITSGNHLQFTLSIGATENYYGATNSNQLFVIIKDPIHLPVSPFVGRYTSGEHRGEYYGLWFNNAYDMYGSKFVVEKNKAEWIGYDWDGTTKTWTGTNTGRTDWTTVTGTDGKLFQGSTNAFVLQNNGYVVFQFRGVPLYTGFSMWFQTATSDGELRVEESADGSSWTKVAMPTSAKADYWTTSGWKNGWMNGNSHYIRFLYTGSNHIVLSANLYENNFVRTDFAPQSTSKVLTDTLVYHQLTKAGNGEWGTFDFTIDAANWGATGVETLSSNPNFYVTVDAPFDPTKGLDNYEAHTAHVHYNGSALYDDAIITLKMHGFYGSTTTDTVRSYSFKVRAVGTQTQMPQTITNANKLTKYLTGTVGPICNYVKSSSHPYGDLQTTDYSYSQGNISPNSGLREHTFEHCFGTDGKPLFDVLYIFGTTTNSDGTTQTYTSYYVNAQGDTLSVKGTYPKISESSSSAGSNAITPLYIYNRSGEEYVLQQTIPNTNVSDQLIQISANGQKIYFSGHCPALSTGYKKDENGGGIFVSGGKGATIDLYFEDCVVRSRTHSDDGRNIEVKDDESYNGKAEGILSTSYPLSTGSTLVFQCTGENNSGNYFTPKVHFMGENRLRSTSGKPAYVLAKNVTRSCSPVEILVNSDKSYTNLTFDDIWLTASTGETERTNGYFRFTKSSAANCPSVDLGNANTILHFAGGRVELQNSVPGSDKYTNTLAVSYRKYMRYYGVGSDRSGGTVNFLDGTVSASMIKTQGSTGEKKDWYTYTEVDAQGVSNTFGLDTVRYLSNGQEVVNYYTNTLRVPEHSYIKGGSHNVPIRTCVDTNDDQYGAATSPGGTPTDGDPNAQKVGRYDVEISVSDIDEKGFAKFNFPDDMGNPTTKQTLAEYYAEKGWYYGLASMAPDANGYIHLWLPLDWLGRIEQESQKVQSWVECLTPIDVKVPTSNGSLMEARTIGGDKEIDTSKKNLNLMYCVIDGTMRSLMAEKSFAMPVKNPISGDYEDRGIEGIGQELQSQITNTGDYVFTDKLYYITTVEADVWKTFTPPFDVKKIYVVNSYPDSIYQEKVKNGSLTRSAALREQAQQNANFAGFIGVGIIMDWYGGTLASYTAEFLRWAYGQDTTSGVYPRSANQKTVNSLKVDYYPTSYQGAKGYTTNYRGMQPIYNFTGKNYDANYYLYHSKGNTWKYNGTKFTTDWEVVVPQDDEILLRAGEIYALQFPYCPGCDDVDSRNYWDYWTGKLIIMEGDGPQTIKGSDAQQDQWQPYDVENSAALRGNATFAKMQVPNYSGATGYLSNAFFHTSGTSKFVPSADQETGNIEPTNVFLLANPGTRLQASPRSIASISVETGSITYEDNVDAETGVPTIVGGHSLIVNSVAGGVEVVPVEAQQVSVYGAAGQLIASDYMTDETTIALPAGIYIVRGEKEMVKVVVR